jgi:hypothetical protein
VSEIRVTDPDTGGEKGMKDERLELLPFAALLEVARVYGYGAKKYAVHNWRKGYAWSLSLGALLRHVFIWSCGESIDRESGRHHLAHAAFHCLTLITFEQQGLGKDDRVREKTDAEQTGVLYGELDRLNRLIQGEDVAGTCTCKQTEPAHPKKCRCEAGSRSCRCGGDLL